MWKHENGKAIKSKKEEGCGKFVVEENVFVGLRKMAVGDCGFVSFLTLENLK